MVTTYNYAAYIVEAINSILAQSDPVDELIVVDDGSTDNTREIVVALNVPELRYIWQENQGAGAARNRGLAAARSPLIAYLDADDRWLPDKIRDQRQFMSKHPKVAMATGGKWRFHARTGERALELFQPVSRQQLRRQLFIHNVLGNPSMALLRKDAVEAVGGFNAGLRWGQDWDLFIRLSHCNTIAVQNKPVIIYRWHPANLTHRRRWERADVLYSISRTHIVNQANVTARPGLVARAISQRELERGEHQLALGARSSALRHAVTSLLTFPFERSRSKIALVAKATLGPTSYRRLRSRWKRVPD